MEFNCIALVFSRALYMLIYSTFGPGRELHAIVHAVVLTLQMSLRFLTELHMCESAGLETALFSQRFLWPCEFRTMILSEEEPGIITVKSLFSVSFSLFQSECAQLLYFYLHFYQRRMFCLLPHWNLNFWIWSMSLGTARILFRFIF